MTTLIRIGNSQGVRIPKTMIEQAKLDDQVLEFKVMDEGLFMKPVSQPRQDWKQQFEKALQSPESKNFDQEWLEAPLVEQKDWEWI